MRTEQIAAKALERLDDDRYKLALMVSKRAEELADGAEPLIQINKNKYKFADIALMEIAQGKVDIESLETIN